jgi:hypothetical protein
VTPQLRAVVEDAYDVFAGYTIRHSLTVCHCKVCMDEETERELLRTPLRETPAGMLAAYTNSAHDWDDGPVAREMRHFLPRYLELIALGDAPCSMGIDICLRRLGQAGWRAKWPTREEEIIDRFFDELMVASLERLGLVRWPVGWRLAFDIVDVLTLVVTAGGDLDRVLAVWDAADDPAAATHMAAARERVLIEKGRTYLYSAYLEDKKEAADRIGGFLMRPEVTARIESAFFKVDDRRLQQILSDAA